MLGFAATKEKHLDFSSSRGGDVSGISSFSCEIQEALQGWLFVLISG